MRHSMGLWLMCAACWTSTTPPASPSAPLTTPSPTVHTRHGMTRVRIDLNDEAELVAAGFTHIPGGTTRFERGHAIVETKYYEEWSQQQGFVQKAANGPWAVEARFSLDLPCMKPSTGLWIHDGKYFALVTVDDHELVYAGARYEIGPTNRMRTYRIELHDSEIAIFVDGDEVVRRPADETMATVTLMFGNLGDSCPQNRSTWDYIAYETAPGTGGSWPPATDWHHGTTLAQLQSAVGSAGLPALERTLAQLPTNDGRLVPCVAIDIVEGAVRDLLPVAYDAQGSQAAAKELRHVAWLSTPQAFSNAERTLAQWMDVVRLPVCDPYPGHPCGPPPPSRPRAPIPPIAPAVREALQHASRWATHPSEAQKAVTLATQAYAAAVAAHLAGADMALARLQAKLARLTGDYPAHCGP